MNKRTDFCETCILLREKKLLQELELHLAQAKCERKFMNDTIKNTQRKFEVGNRSVVHVSWDMAEAIRLPVWKDQPGSAYFESGFQCGFCGVSNNTTGVMDTYVLQEGYWPGATPEGIISMLHHYFNTSIDNDVEILEGMMDNCSAQNKNRWLLQYLLYRVLVWGPANIHTHYLIPGHTKMRNDALFGLIKRMLAQLECFTYAQVREAVDGSTAANKAVQNKVLIFYAWKEFLEQFFGGQSVTGIMQYRRWEFSCACPGTVRYKKTSEDVHWESKTLLRPGITLEHLREPEKFGLRPLPDFEVKLNGLGEVRRSYLQKKFIQPYFIGEKQQFIGDMFELS